jgi:uracil-DNA glycosylase
VRCPRLVAWREEAARNPPRRFAGETYWARPVPAFGDPRARILIVGLAPAAHGGNRTGRVFTGDASGDFLFRALHAVGLANQPVSVRPGDGLALAGVLISAAVKCAPPDNRPLPEEFDACRGYLEREAAAIPARVWVALGALAFETCLALLARRGAPIPRPKPRFAHGGEYTIGGVEIFATYHPSQQNTFTGKLTQPMLRRVFRRAAAAAGRVPETASSSTAAPARRSSRSPSPSASSSSRERGPRSK